MQKLTTAMLDLGPTRLYHEVRGTGPLVLMIAGATGDAGQFEPVATRLAERYTVVTYDRRGNSRSPRPDGWTTTTMEEQADDAAALVRRLGRGPAIVFGTSGGAIITLALVLRHPEVVAGAILHEPPLAAVVPGVDDELAHLKRSIAETAAAYGPASAVEAFVRSQAGAAYDAIAPGTRLRMLGNADTLFGAELDAFVTWRPDDAALAASQVPARVLLGTETTPMFEHAARWVAERLGAPIGRLAGAHAPYFDRPDATADALRALIEELAR
ncbi:MAG TPA: alpha/beta hydrolase [Kofleriaceae bacterium]|nr:alpha/beta hydrolase [Kofleriaceae bacterium]